MTRPRPTSVTVMAILNIVMGSLFLLCYLCSGVSLIAQNANLNKQGAFNGDKQFEIDLERRLRTEVPGYQAFEVGNTLVHLALSILLLMSGIGLLGVHRWAHLGSIIYGVVTILVETGGLFYQLAFLNPVMNRAFEDFERRGQFGPGGPSAATLVTIVNVVIVIVHVLLMLYAIVLLIMMMLPRVRAAFSAGLPLEESLAERYEESGEEYERQRDPWNY